jgi:hypothetical protein
MTAVEDRRLKVSERQNQSHGTTPLTHGENQMNKEKWTKLWYDPFDPFDGFATSAFESGS